VLQAARRELAVDTTRSSPQIPRPIALAAAQTASASRYCCTLDSSFVRLLRKPTHGSVQPAPSLSLAQTVLHALNLRPDMKVTLTGLIEQLAKLGPVKLGFYSTSQPDHLSLPIDLDMPGVVVVTPFVSIELTLMGAPVKLQIQVR